MAIPSGNFTVQVSMEIRSRRLLIPWIKTVSAICCHGFHQSSGPVRYIPKNYSWSKENQSSSPMKSPKEKAIDHHSDSNLLKNAASQDRKVRQRILSLDKRSQNKISPTEKIPDAAMAFLEFKSRTNHDLEIVDLDLMEDSEELTDEVQISDVNKACEAKVMCTSKIKQDVEKMAIEALAKRAFTAVELRKKLHGKKFPLDIIEAVLADFHGRGLINDYLYAESFTRSKWLSLSWGPKRIKQALNQKGVKEADSEKAMKQIFEDDDLGGDRQDMVHGMSKLSMDRLFDQASKQWLRGQNILLEKRKLKIVRWLQYRGFSWGVTAFILKKLETQYPP